MANLSSLITAAVPDGDKGDITVLGATWTIDTGVVTTAKLADTSVTNAKLAFDGGAFSFRNKIIGGDFTTNPWQRGTSASYSGNSSGYLADRFIYQADIDAAVNILKTADAPTVSEAGIFTQHCLHIDVTTADTSIAAGQYATFEQRIEGLNAASLGFGQSGTRYITLSFWVKATKTGIYCVRFRGPNANRTYIAEYTVSVSNTWEKKTITIQVDTTGSWLYDNGIGLIVTWTLATGSTYHTTAGSWQTGNYYATANQVNALDSTSNDFKLALVQLEAGSVATPFEARPYGVEEMLCQRYYYRIKASGTTYRLSDSGYAINTTQCYGQTVFPVSMRGIPSALEQSGAATDYVAERFGSGTWTTCSSVPAFLAATYGSAFTAYTVASGLVNSSSGSIYAANANAYLGWSAEL